MNMTKNKGVSRYVQGICCVQSSGMFTLWHVQILSCSLSGMLRNISGEELQLISQQ